jgi:transmembrane sensor
LKKNQKPWGKKESRWVIGIKQVTKPCNQILNAMAKSERPYHQYGVQEFLMDDYFQQWVHQPDWESNAFWKTWLLQHPEKGESIEEARQLLAELSFQEDLPSRESRERVWQQIMATNADRDDEKSGQAGRTVQPKSYRYWQGIAASFAGIIVLAGLLWFYLQQPQIIKYQTGFAEIQSIVLPDGSKVKLNANSTLSLKKNWQKATFREVWLNGEAFFSVVHTADDRKFVVHASDAVNVEVLGTEFNVYERGKETRVLLTSGQVKLNILESGTTQQVLMQPGEQVEVVMEDDNTYRHQQKLVNAEVVTAWTDRKLVFDNTPLAEVVTVLEVTYGIEISIEDTALLEKKLWGSVPLGDVDEVLTGLAKTFNWNIRQEGKKVRIQQ